AVGVLIGVAYLAAGWAAGNLTFGLTGLAIMLALSVGFVLAARRSETVRGLLDHRDERISAIDLRATAFAGMVVIALVLGAFIVEIARGEDGMPYAWLGAAGGIAYVVAVLVQRVRG
ncbi:MAG: hypothetical protein AB7V44_29240, partial [Pseudonocardia sp.]